MDTKTVAEVVQEKSKIELQPREIPSSAPNGQSVVAQANGQPKKSNKWIWLAILILALIGGGLYWFLY